MKKILSTALAICLMSAVNSYAQDETANEVAPSESPLANSVVEQQETPPTIVTLDSQEVFEVPSVADVIQTDMQSNNVVGQASPIQTNTGMGCGYQQTNYMQTMPAYNNVQTYRVFPRSYRAAPVYTNQPTYMPMPRPLFRGRVFGGGWRYR